MIVINPFQEAGCLVILLHFCTRLYIVFTENRAIAQAVKAQGRDRKYQNSAARLPLQMTLRPTPSHVSNYTHIT